MFLIRLIHLKKIKNDIHIPFIDLTNRMEDVQHLISFNVQHFCNSDHFKVNDEIIEINKAEFFNLPFLVQLKIEHHQKIIKYV